MIAQVILLSRGKKNTVDNVVEFLKKASGWLHLVVGDDVATVHTSR